jgi:NADH:ubiquinone oxidoreductase subunit E
MSGGGCAIPRAVANMKAMFPGAVFPVGKFEVSEIQCIGACLHGKFLYEQVIDGVAVRAGFSMSITLLYITTSL